MPRKNIIERKYECTFEGCSKAYSYQSGLCNHIRNYHSDLYEEKKKQRKITKTPIERLRKDDDLNINLQKIIEERDEMKQLIIKSESVRTALETGKFTKEWISVLVAILKGSVTVENGWVNSKIPVSDDIFRPLAENFIVATEDYLFDNVHSKEEYVLKNIYDVHNIVLSLSEKLPFYVQELRKVSERNLKK